MDTITNYSALADEDWSNVNFGDKRLNRRAIEIGVAFLRNPFVSPPKMLKEFKNIKAFYRFMDSEKVSHDKLVSPHITKARQRISNEKVILAIQDSTTMTFKRNYEIDGLYDVGNIPGLVVHNTISVIPYKTYGIIDGLLNQTILQRKPKELRTKEDNELRLWTDSITEVGKPPEKTTIVDVMDRGADALEVMHYSKNNLHEFVIRASYNRLINYEHYNSLFEFAKSLPKKGQHKLDVQGHNGKKKRVAKLNISFSEITLPAPKNKQHLNPLICNLIRVYEEKPPKDQEQLEWILLTSLEVNTLEDALLVVQYYTYRWIIEEYHKCMKTGFRIEQTQLKSLDRIESLLGFIAVSSVKLLQLRDIVRHNPDADAQSYVDREDVQIVCAYYKVKETKMTIDRFLRYIAQMGGFLNRKSDGNPGWQSLWDGWKFFMGLKEGAKLYREGLICG